MSVGELADYAVELCTQSQHNRVLIAIAGIPGSGKSTLAAKVSGAINSRSLSSASEEQIKKFSSCVVGMDGFHYPRSVLAQMENPHLAFARRGALFTFDGKSAVEFVRSLRATCLQPEHHRAEIRCASFDHAKKDPVEGGTVVEPNTNIIFIEGLYVLVDLPPWCKIAELVDERWFVQVKLDVAAERVAKRHLESGIESSMAAARERAERNDMENARLVLAHLLPYDRVVCSPRPD